LSWPCFWNGSCFFRLCRHYQKEAKDKRICAAHQATAFCCPVSFFFGFPYFFGGYCIAFWAFLFLGRKINCATGATTTAVEEEDRTQNREMHRFKGQKRVGHTARRILKKAGQELSKWQRRVRIRSSLLIKK